MRAKKILFLANGSSIHTAKWVDYFIKSGYEVSLATFDTDHKTRCEKVFYLSESGVKQGGGNYHYLLSIFKLSKIIDEVIPDYINAHYSYSMGFIAAMAINFAKIKPSLSTVCHGSDILVPPMPFITKLLNRYVLDKSGKVFSVSDGITDEVTRLLGSADKVFDGQYGVNIPNRIKNKDIDIISNRAFTNNSRLGFLLDALTPYQESKLNIVFIMPGVTDKKRLELERKYKFVTFYGALEHARLLDYVARSKIYISATKSDGASISLIEALASNVIPLVSNISANRSWILDGVNGFLFRNKIEFQKRLDEILKLDTLEIDLINNLNKQTLERKASYNIQMKKIEAFLTK